LPPQGNYQIEITNKADIGNYQISLLGPNNKPTITVDSPAADLIWDGTSPVEISWTAEDMDDNADIDLYFDTDNTGNNGILITSGIKEEDAVSSYQWNIDQNIQSGAYYVYAKIDDGENAPLFAYSAGKIAIENPNAPAVPSNVVVTSKDGGLKLEWDENTEENLTGYRVYLSDNPGSGIFNYDFGVGMDTSYEIQGIVNGQDYEVAVSAVNSDGFESSLSVSQQATPNGTGVGGSPDLMVDTDNSSVTLNSDSEDVIMIQVRINNIGTYDSYSARVSCYYGEISEANFIGTQLVGQIDAGNYLDAEFEFDTGVLLSNPTSKGIFVNINEVVLPELETGNNLGIIKNALPKDKPCKARFMADPVSGFAPLTVTFDGSGSQGESFEWDYGDGSAKGTGKTPSHIYTSSGVYSASLTADDPANNCTDTRTVTITVISTAEVNQPPIAYAGPNQMIYESEMTAILDGSGSYDPNPGDIIAYRWNQTAGTAVELSDPTDVKPRFTVSNIAEESLEFELTVTDGVLEDKAKVMIIVKKLKEYHSGDYNPADHKISLSELLRVVQLYNSESYHCDSEGEDGYAVGNGDKNCMPHDSDYNPQDWSVSLSELLRFIQLYKSSEYQTDPNGEDGFSPIGK